MSTYILKIDSQPTVQSKRHTSFIGGKPRLPEDVSIPFCKLCGELLTFFFQVTFPREHTWQGLSLAVFACTACAHGEYIIPPMWEQVLPGANIPASFLESYQINFRLLVFDSIRSTIRTDYKEKVKFRNWELIPTSSPHIRQNKIGGIPSWILEDEAPATCDNRTPMFFLMQICNDFRFETVDNALSQKELYEDFPGFTPRPYYQLWIGNFIYFFGTADRDFPLVYVITQVE